ncbi:MAG: TonB-dependent receptor [Bacteroidota bacterium]
MKKCFFVLILIPLSFATYGQQSETDSVKQHHTIGYHANQINAEYWHSFTMPVNRIVGLQQGVNVRQQGGMGSSYTYSLDGISGSGVAFLIDGIPTQYLGSSYAINNFPTALLNRIEVYKGVTPVELGADALGGVINIVTIQPDTSFLDLSYSVGSFNTHQAHLNGQWIDEGSGFITKISSYYTQTDNNYEVWGDEIISVDQQGRRIDITKDNPFTRFNDDLRIIHAKPEIGFTNTKWADKLMVGLTVSDLERGIQNGDNINSVYGEVRLTEQFIMPHLHYQKNDLFVKGLSVNSFNGYSIRENTLIDTSSYLYNWSGDKIIQKSIPGETTQGGVWQSTTYSALVSRFAITYKLSDNHRLSLNYVRQGLNQQNDNNKAEPDFPNPEPIHSTSSFVGLSGSSAWLQKRLNISVFVKRYSNQSETESPSFITPDETNPVSYDEDFWGWGLSAGFDIVSWLKVKSSVERTVNMPSSYQVLGDNIYTVANEELKPEQSFNVNAGLTLNQQVDNVHFFQLDINGFHRDVEDQIFQVQQGSGFSGFVNYMNIISKGVEANLNYKFTDVLSFDINTTYMSVVNNNESGPLASFYEDRIPNTPYFMTNFVLKSKFDNVFITGSRVLSYLQMSHVGEFLLNWESTGVAELKTTIPAQTLFDWGVSYQLPFGITTSLDITNIFNEQVYDFITFQRPGRAFWLRMRYRL